MCSSSVMIISSVVFLELEGLMSFIVDFCVIVRLMLCKMLIGFVGLFRVR